MGLNSSVWKKKPLVQILKSAALVYCLQKCIADGVDYVENYCFVAENLWYLTLLQRSLNLFSFPWQ